MAKTFEEKARMRICTRQKFKEFATTCIRCGGYQDIELHHIDYNFPDFVIPLCSECHYSSLEIKDIDELIKRFLFKLKGTKLQKTYEKVFIEYNLYYWKKLGVDIKDAEIVYDLPRFIGKLEFNNNVNNNLIFGCEVPLNLPKT